jgi:hypothetical protein
MGSIVPIHTVRTVQRLVYKSWWPIKKPCQAREPKEPRDPTN